jgi:hypothetical protein
MGKKPKKRKYKAAVEQFRMNRYRIEYAQKTAFSMLARKEIMIRKLLGKFCDPLLDTGQKDENTSPSKGRVLFTLLKPFQLV